MRRRLLFLPLLVATAFAASPTPAERNAAFRQAQHGSEIDRQLDLAAKDIEADRFEAALARIVEVEKLRPNDAIVLNTKGAALVELRRFDEAKVALEAAAAADPESFAPRYNLGEILSLQKKHLEAAGHFTVLETRFGELPLLKFKVYVSYALADRIDRAAERLATLRFPDDGAAWYFAQAADRLLAGKKREAERLMATATAIHPDEEVAPYRDTLRDSGLLK